MTTSSEKAFLVIMGVAGCGKSSLGSRCAQALGVPLLEGDDFHSAQSVKKMRSGVPLTDADRHSWLDVLAKELQLRLSTGCVLTCSALRQRYRDHLRQAVPGLRFVFLALTPAQARERVAARPAHLFPVSLVASQFEALEDPCSEPGVLSLDATASLESLEADVVRWVRVGEPDGPVEVAP
ncbi:gluconokinase [Hydrogenophaga palleronii]|uniref:Gluconokinase n=1 Tax=Hydrogenophaga palleronii TaxID=65655 RepID=A0ABU1WJ17_9BURK|nr:gluconokinase [Hydrogenophaga palleronii]MDR7149277.1 gluconokinase [Hydrogenophaga palleronii]